MTTFKLNQKPMSFTGDPSTPLLWVLRDHFKLTGTKFGCGIGECGACTIHINGKAVKSCITPIASIDLQEITTIEGLAKDGQLTAVQQAWIDEDVPQCGYCQAGQIMAVTEFLQKHPEPTTEQIKQEITNICRCGTYVRVHKAILLAAKTIKMENSHE